MIFPAVISKRERILQALHMALSALPVAVQRGGSWGETLPPEGLLILRDGDPGAPEVTLSPVTYHYVHAVEIEAFLSAHDHGDASFDLLTVRLGAALNADQTLGGLCHWVQTAAPQPIDVPGDLGALSKAAIVVVELHYSTDDPLT